MNGVVLAMNGVSRVSYWQKESEGGREKKNRKISEE